MFEREIKSVDVVVHECFGINRNASYVHKHGHSTAKDAGEVAAAVGARVLVLTHIPPISDTNALEEEAKQYFSGTVLLARDLLEIPL